MSICLFTACPSDDDEDIVSSKTQKFLGQWYNNKSKISMTFYDDAKMYYHNSRNYQWNYNENTGILTTTAEMNGNNLQWEITFSDTTSWTGIKMWDDKSSILFERTHPRSTAYTVLNGRTWINSTDNSEWECKIIGGTTTFHGFTSNYSYLTLNNNGERYNLLHNDDETVVESIKQDNIIIIEDIKKKNLYGEYIIEHPYSYKNIRLKCTFRDGRTTPYMTLNLRPKD